MTTLFMVDIVIDIINEEITTKNIGDNVVDAYCIPTHNIRRHRYVL